MECCYCHLEIHRDDAKGYMGDVVCHRDRARCIELILIGRGKVQKKLDEAEKKITTMTTVAEQVQENLSKLKNQVEDLEAELKEQMT